jgi:hypothetical protein
VLIECVLCGTQFKITEVGTFYDLKVLLSCVSITVVLSATIWAGYLFAVLHILQTGKRLIANEISSRSAEEVFCRRPSMLTKASQLYPKSRFDVASEC